MRRRRSGSPFSLFSFQDAITSVCGVIVLITLLMALDLTRRATEETAPSAVARERVEETERRIEELRNNLSSVQATLDATAHIDEAALGMTIEEALAELEAARERLEATRAENAKIDERLEALAAVEERFAGQEARLKALEEQAKEAREEAEKTVAQAVDSERSVLYRYPENVGEIPHYVDISGAKIVVHTERGEGEVKTFDTPFSFTKWANTRPSSKEYFVLIVRPSGAEAFDFIESELDSNGYRYGIDLVGESRELVFLPAEGGGE